ncbi:MAG: hypothetical protein HY833_00995 [Candidatus Aenigmarchaeota archaeon]|nr:hypothetical protein [Candidatus Aenigmarchaeota archaeon]
MKRKMWGILDDDVWSEAGKAIAFSIPVSFVLAIFYYKNPGILLMLSMTVDAATIMDVFAHAFASAAICGLLFAMIRKNSDPKGGAYRHAAAVSAVLALLIMIPGWEGFESVTGKSVVMINEDWPKDVISDFAGVLSYVGIEGLRNRLKDR